MAVRGMLPLAPAERQALEHDYRWGADRLVRQRAHMILLAHDLDNQTQISRVIHCSRATVNRTLQLYRRGGRVALRRRSPTAPRSGRVTPAWRDALTQAMAGGPGASGLARPTWTAPLLAQVLGEQTGITVSERTVRPELARLGYVCRRSTWTVRHKAEAEPDYLPKGRGSKRW